MRAHHGRIDRAADLLAERIGGVRALHQRADDVLSSGAAAEKVALGGHLRLVVEDRRVAGMGDEIGEIVALRQVASEGRGGVEHDHHRASLQLGRNLGGHLADRDIGHGEDDDIGAVERRVLFDAGDAEFVSEPLAAILAHFDMPDLEVGIL